MMNQATQKRTVQHTQYTRGWLIASVSLALIFGIAFLKGRVK
jgi:hypothetical protein